MLEFDYYCYSSGCLSVVLGFLGASADETYSVCRNIQDEWSRGELSRYNIVDEFLDRLLPADEESFFELLPRLNVISTSFDSVVDIQRPTSRAELLSVLRRTTHIPFLTGRGWLKHDEGRYLDGMYTRLNLISVSDATTFNKHRFFNTGGFSRMFHPPCRWSIQVPVTWNTYAHSLNPGVGRDLVFEFVELGTNHSQPFTSHANNFENIS